MGKCRRKGRGEGGRKEERKGERKEGLFLFTCLSIDFIPRAVKFVSMSVRTMTLLSFSPRIFLFHLPRSIATACVHLVKREELWTCVYTRENSSSSRSSLVYLDVVLWPFKTRQVHKIWADGRISTEPLGGLTCLYSQVGNPCMLQAACPLCVTACHTACLCSFAWHPAGTP